MQLAEQGFAPTKSEAIQPGMGVSYAAVQAGENPYIGWN